MPSHYRHFTTHAAYECGFTWDEIKSIAETEMNDYGEYLLDCYDDVILFNFFELVYKKMKKGVINKKNYYTIAFYFLHPYCFDSDCKKLQPWMYERLGDEKKYKSIEKYLINYNENFFKDWT